MRRGLILLLLVVFPGYALAQDRAEMESLLRLIGFDTHLGAVSRAMANPPADSASPDGGRAWQEAAAMAFDPNDMFDDIVQGMAGRITPDQMARLNSFFMGDLGLRMTQIEEDAQSATDQDAQEAEGARIFASLLETDPDRVGLYQQLVEGMDAIDTGFATALNLNYAVLSGMAASDMLPFSLTEDQILDFIRAQSDEIYSMISESVFTTIAYTYRDVSDADMAAYVAFLLGADGAALYDAMNAVSDQVLEHRARQFGTLLIEMQAAQEL